MAEKGTATGEVAEETLSQAWDEAVASEKEEPEVKETDAKETPETATEVQPPVEKPASAESKEAEKDESIDHQESSRLGRKVKGLSEKMDQILESLNRQAQPPVQRREQIEEPEEVVATSTDVEKVIQAREERKIREKTEYEANYLKQISSLKAADDDLKDLHDEIVAEMLDNYNVMYDIKNPSADARVNYAEAKASVLKKKATSSKPKVPRRDTAETAPVQPAASATHAVTKPFVLPKLDEAAQNYVNYLRKSKNMSDEDIAKKLA